MIYLFTDFTHCGPYVGQMHAAIKRIAPDAAIVDLMHDAPGFNVTAAARLLEALVEYTEPGDIHCAVIDPGVGHVERMPVALHADGRWFVGPGNGLFAGIAQRADQVNWYEISWQPPRLSRSFHGRDIFAPTAARIHAAQALEGLLSPLETPDKKDIPAHLPEVIYIDGYGNCITGMGAESLTPSASLKAGSEVLHFQPTFSYAERDQPFWYVNSIGLVEVAVNQGNAAQQLGLRIGSPLGFPVQD